MTISPQTIIDEVAKAGGVDPRVIGDPRVTRGRTIQARHQVALLIVDFLGWDAMAKGLPHFSAEALGTMAGSAVVDQYADPAAWDLYCTARRAIIAMGGKPRFPLEDLPPRHRSRENEDAQPQAKERVK